MVWLALIVHMIQCYTNDRVFMPPRTSHIIYEKKKKTHTQDKIPNAFLLQRHRSCGT